LNDRAIGVKPLLSSGSFSPANLQTFELKNK
jgi:hypothetical protein